jgi:hypothetical protein
MIFQENIRYWISGNEKIDNFAQEMEFKIEWIPYNWFNGIKKIDTDGFSTIYSAVWEDGPLLRNIYYYKEGWMRDSNKKVALKCLHNSQNMIEKVLNEV